MISLVVAVSENGVIGKDNALPWRIPEDLKHFKEVTMGGAIIMGRRTYESIGRPLPGRRNIVVSSNPDFRPEGVQVARHLEEAIQLGGSDAFIIGGATLYRESLPLVDRLVLTRVHARVEGDTYFPEMEWSDWTVTEESRQVSSTGIPFSFIEARRIR